MKNDFILASLSVFCLWLTKLDVNDVMLYIARCCTYGSFIVILISNWKNLVPQLKKWFRNDKK